MIDPSIKDHSRVALGILRQRDHHLADHIHQYIQALEQHYSETIHRACHHEEIAKHHEHRSNEHHARVRELEQQVQNLQKHVPTEHFAPVVPEGTPKGGGKPGGDTTPVMGTSGGDVLEAIRAAEEKKAAEKAAAKPFWKFWG